MSAPVAAPHWPRDWRWQLTWCCANARATRSVEPCCCCCPAAARPPGPKAVPRAVAAAGHVARQGIASVVVDCESPRGIRLRLARDVARALAAEYLDLGDIAAGALSGVVRDRGVA